MGALILTLVNFILGTLVSLLPLSPLTGMRVDESFETGIGWLNWFVDLNGMVSLFAAALAAGLLWAAIRLVINHIDAFIGSATK